MEGFLALFSILATSDTAPIHLLKSPTIASSSRPAAKARLIPPNAAVAVEIAAEIVRGSIVTFLNPFGLCQSYD